jgi:hypothetical protein
MTINYPLDVQEQFTRLLKQRADQAKKATGAGLAEWIKLEHAESGPLSPADVRSLPMEMS